jgi:hypothetical protein
MPFGIMAINALICGILCMTLPETNKKAMPDTIKQVDDDSKESGVEANGDDEDSDEKAQLAPIIMLETAA